MDASGTQIRWVHRGEERFLDSLRQRSIRLGSSPHLGNHTVWAGPDGPDNRVSGRGCFLFAKAGNTTLDFVEEIFTKVQNLEQLDNSEERCRELRLNRVLDEDRH